MAVDPAGKVHAGNNDRLQLMALKPETRTQIEQSGLRIFNRLALPPGRYTVRLATHDSAGGALGSVALQSRRSRLQRAAFEHERPGVDIYHH